jgi:hypothetical protein
MYGHCQSLQTPVFVVLILVHHRSLRHTFLSLRNKISILNIIFSNSNVGVYLLRRLLLNTSLSVGPLWHATIIGHGMLGTGSAINCALVFQCACLSAPPLIEHGYRLSAAYERKNILKSWQRQSQIL